MSTLMAVLNSSDGGYLERHCWEVIIGVTYDRRVVVSLGAEFPEMSRPDQIGHVEILLDRLRNGDDSAHNELIENANADERLQSLARKMIHWDRVHRWADTDDLLQNALLRLHRALLAKKPQSARHFFNLAVVQIRREMLDLAKHYFGPEGAGAHHSTDKLSLNGGGRLRCDKEDSTNFPAKLFNWTLFHEQVEALPEKEREVFSLRWYGGLKCAEIAKLLETPIKTVERTWRSARLRLRKAMDGTSPD